MNGWHALAARQYGVISRVQLRQEGLTDRRVDTLIANGSVERMHSGVYRVSGSHRGPRQRRMAACLWCGPDALLADATAGHLLQLPVSERGRIYLVGGADVRRTHPDIVVRRSTSIERKDRYEVDGLPCTSPTRTLIDLAAVLPGEELEHAFEVARRMGLATKTVVAHRLHELGGRGRAGSTQLRELLSVLDGRPKESKLEVRAARLLRDFGMHPDATQHRVGQFRLDFAWLRKMRAVECDGFDWHGNRLAWKRDRRRLAELEVAGWQLLHLTWADATRHRDQTVHRVRLFLER
jgi:very-short-patch-repair endonuclease